VAKRRERAKRRTQELPPKGPGDAAVKTGQGDPDLDLQTQVRSQVNATTIEALAEAAEDQLTEREDRRRRHRHK